MNFTDLSVTLIAEASCCGVGSLSRVHVLGSRAYCPCDVCRKNVSIITEGRKGHARGDREYRMNLLNKLRVVPDEPRLAGPVDLLQQRCQKTTRCQRIMPGTQKGNITFVFTSILV